jgi:hypothetical protein
MILVLSKINFMKKIFNLAFSLVIVFSLFSFLNVDTSLASSRSRIPTVSCGDSEDNDGSYVACLGDSIRHKNSKVSFTVEGFNARENEVKIKLNRKSVTLEAQERTTVTFSRNKSLTITFTGASAQDGRLMFNVKTTSDDDFEDDEDEDDDDYEDDDRDEKYDDSRRSNRRTNRLDRYKSKCGDSEGNNGTYSSCIGDKIKHTRARADVKIIKYDKKEDILTIKINNSKNIKLEKDEEYTHKTRRNRNLKVTYTGIGADNRFMVVVKN